MAKKSYWEQLKDPRWQKMRLKVLERENWTCQDCGEPDKTLHVHHTYYERGKAPWEYPDNALRALCEDCHQNVEQTKASLEAALRAISDDTYLLEKVTGYANALNVSRIAREEPRVGMVDMANAGEVEGVADFMQVNGSREAYMKFLAAIDKSNKQLWCIDIDHFKGQQ